MDKHLSEKAKEMLNNKETKVFNHPKSLKKRLFKSEKKVTIVTAAYNAEQHIKKCVNSVINQTLSFDKIEFIIIDDHSSDNTAEILVDYSKKYSNITVVLLEENTGAAAMPRNVGIELATTDKILFLDSDDWLAEDGIKKLVETMDRNNDDFVTGRTIKVEDSSKSIHAEFMSYKNRYHMSPFDIPYLLYYMGPQSKLIKTKILKENDIRFPEMKFGEDKHFLLRVLTHCNFASTIKDTVCYLNRMNENNASLTKTTDVLYKREADMKILKTIYDMELPTNIERKIMKRLVEYDLIKACDSFVFVRSDNKEGFIKYIREALNILKDRPYNIIESFDTPLYQVAAKLVLQGKEQDFIDLFRWYKLEKNKHIVIKDGQAYYDVYSFDQDHIYKLIPIKLFVRANDSYVENNFYVQTFEIYGDEISKVEHVLIRDRNNTDNELTVPVKITGNNGEFRVSYEDLNILTNSLFSVFIRYNGHHLVNIKRINENSITYKKRNFQFYTTKAGNIGFSLK